MDEKCVRDPRHDCFGLEAAARLEGRIKALEDWQQDSKKFHNSFYDWQREQIAREAKLDEQLSNMNRNIQKLLDKQEEDDAKPGKLMDTLKSNAIWAILAAVIGFFLGNLGL